MFKKNTGKQLESYVQYVYDRLLYINGYSDVVVSKRVTMLGQSGATNEFDVYYQFKHLNLEHKVVIECKDWKKLVSIKEVRDFVSKLNDVGMGEYRGVMISRNGYQEGAIAYAKSNGITLLIEDDLPKIPELVVEILRVNCVPDGKVKGQPFWCLMEFENGHNTGIYYALENGNGVPLFYTKHVAENFLNKVVDKERFVVIGISQNHLKTIIRLIKNLNMIVHICLSSSIVIELKQTSVNVLEEYVI